MKNQKNSLSSLFIIRKSLLLLIQFFLIVAVYHTLKDLKDTIVITASEAGAEVIPFIKIWGMLPASIAASYLFACLYNRYGRETTLYILVSLLMGAYLIFALLLYPFREQLYLHTLHDQLTTFLPIGCKGLIAMVCFWHYTFFYLAAELWSPLILSVLFWGYVNETTTLAEAKKFYPICMIVGNCAGVVSGQASHWLCHDLQEFLSWEQTMQWMIGAVTLFGIMIMAINRLVSRKRTDITDQPLSEKPKSKSFTENVMTILHSRSLICIAILVVGFGLTSNLIEVVWKENIRKLHPSPQEYNAYMNQLTSIIGLFAVCLAFISRWIFQWCSWTVVALLTPVSLLVTTTLFFGAQLVPAEYLAVVSSVLSVSPLFLIVTCGSIHYVLAMTAKYTLFDTSKEMAFLSVDKEERTQGKSVIDSIGSRLGKSGASCLYQFLLIVFGSASGYISVIGATSICMIAISIIAAKKLGNQLSPRPVAPEILSTSGMSS